MKVSSASGSVVLMVPISTPAVFSATAVAESPKSVGDSLTSVTLTVKSCAFDRPPASVVVIVTS